MFVIPEVDESTPVSANQNEVFLDGALKDQTRKDDEAALKNGETSDKLKMPPVEGTKPAVLNNLEKRAGNVTRDTGDLSTIEENKREYGLSVVVEAKPKEGVASMAQEEPNKVIREVKSAKDSNSTESERGVADKNDELVIVNGVYEDMNSTETTQNNDSEAKPELVTVKEGYSLAAPKQQVMLANEGQNSEKSNGVLPTEKSTGQQEQQRTGDTISGLLPLETTNKRDSGEFRPKAMPKQNGCESTVGSSASATPVEDSSDKLKTSLELSDIPLTFEHLNSRKDNTLTSSPIPQQHGPKKSAANVKDRNEGLLQNGKLERTEKGGKTYTTDQSHSDEISRDVADDSPWILQLPSSSEKPNIERKNKRKRSSENGTAEQAVPRVTIEQSDVFERSDVNDTLEERNESGTEEQNEKDTEDEKPRKRRASEPDVRFEPLSPLMEDRESNNTFLNPSGAQSAKVKRNKSFVSRGLSKMFGGKRKYKVDKEDKNSSSVPVDSADNNTTHDEFDFKENRQEKKKKKKDRNERRNEGQLPPGGDDKSPSRKFGGLFSRGKKKEKNSNQNERK